MALASLAIAAPARAQRVSLLTFADAPAIDTGDGIGLTIPADEMVRDFHLLGNGPGGSAIPPTAALVVPRWLRRWSPPAPLAGMMPVGHYSACAALPYRPRRNLALATEARRARLYALVAQAACEAGLPVGLFDALVVQESRYNQAAVSPKGAIGLSQLMPGTARYLSVADPFDALSNLRGGARYLREQLAAFGRVDLALAAYNAGPGRVRAHWAVPRIGETQNYVSSITRGWNLGVARETALLDVRLVSPPLPTPTPVPTGASSAHLILFGNGG